MVVHARVREGHSSRDLDKLMSTCVFQPRHLHFYINLWHGVVWFGVVWRGVASCDAVCVVWCGVGVVWCVVAWCGVVW